MDWEELSDRLSCTDNPSTDAPVHQSHTFRMVTMESLGFELDLDGRLHIDYKPRGKIMRDDDFIEMFDVLNSEGTEPAQTFIVKLYRALADLLYPNQSYLDNPWDRLPMVVELEAEDSDGMVKHRISLGSYH